MLTTELSPLSGSGERLTQSPEVGRRGVLGRTMRPPRGFTTIKGTPSNVRFSEATSVPPLRGRTRAQRLGLAYETRVHDVLDAIYGQLYRHDQPILFEDRSGLRRAIPDGLLRIGRTLVVVEVKLSHTERAWYQLTNLYIPLLRQMVEPDVSIRGVEICYNFDPDLRWPEPFELVTSLHEWTRKGGATDRGLGVIQWRI